MTRWTPAGLSACRRGGQALVRGDNASARVKLSEALALWRGPPLTEVADEPFAQAEIARLEALHLRALEDRLEADLALGRHGDAVAELEALVVEHPLHERFWGQLMLAQYRGGRQGHALRTYQTVRALLVERLGIEPGSETAAAARRHPGPGSLLGAPASTPDEPPNNLPHQLATFIGREWELAEIRETLHNTGWSPSSVLAAQARAALPWKRPWLAWRIFRAAPGSLS